MRKRILVREERKTRKRDQVSEEERQMSEEERTGE